MMTDTTLAECLDDPQANFSFDVELPPLRGEYQTGLVEAAVSASNGEKRRVILYCPTGGGKTEMGMHICNDELMEGGCALWLVNRIELIEQTSRRFSAAGINHGIIQGRHRLTDPTQPMQIGSIQTVIRRKELPFVPTRIIIDEAHGAAAAIYRNWIAEYPDVPVIGLTATPWSKALGAKQKALGGEPLFYDVVWKVKPADLVRMGYLCDIRAYAPSAPDLSKVRVIAGDYDERQLAAAVDRPALIADIVKTWQKWAPNKRTICFATNIDHSKHIVAEFRAAGIEADHIDAYTEPAERELILGRLRSGKTQVISNVSLLAEGFDLPALECMILARPTKSRTRWFQMIGRVMRPFAGKPYGIVLDHSGSIEELGFPTDDVDLTLDDGKKQDKKTKQVKDKKKVCPKCAHVRDAHLDTCPACGFKPERVPGNVAVGDGELVERSKLRYPFERRQAIYSALVGYEMAKGYKRGWAAYQYKEMCGQWPNSLRYEAGAMVDEVNKYLLYQRIRKAKAKEAAAKNMCRCGSTKVRHVRMGGSTELTCMSCGNSWFRK